MVRAVAVMLVAGALTPVALRPRGAYADLVYLAGSGTAWNQPATAALVVLKDVLGVKLEESEPSKDVGWWALFFGSGFVREVR